MTRDVKLALWGLALAFALGCIPPSANDRGDPPDAFEPRIHCCDGDVRAPRLDAGLPPDAEPDPDAAAPRCDAIPRIGLGQSRLDLREGGVGRLEATPVSCATDTPQHSFLFRFSLDTPADVYASVRDPLNRSRSDLTNAWLTFVPGCAVNGAEHGCVDLYDATYVFWYVPRGETLVRIDLGPAAWEWPQLELRVEPRAEVCEPVAIIEGEGARGFIGRVFEDDRVSGTPCGDGGTGAEAVYRLRLDRTMSVAASVQSAAFTPVVYLRQSCGDRASEIACGASTRDGLARLGVDRLGAGEYDLVVDSDYGLGAFSLDVMLAEPPECSNGEDDDGDGEIDTDDPGCASPFDDDERNPACSNGLDDDGDGLVDADDPGCANPVDDSELDPACANGLDDDSDGLVDEADPGCDGPTDDDEYDAPRPACSNGVDDDGDGLIDDDDPGCTAPHDRNEQDPPACSNRRDDDGDGFTDLNDRGCQDALDDDEADLECDDDLDNDGDGRVDAADPGCLGELDDDEADPPSPPECADGVDNDLDGRVDFPDDPDCGRAATERELAACDVGKPVVGPRDAEVALGPWALRAGLGLDGCVLPADARGSALVRIYADKPSNIRLTLVDEAGAPAPAAIFAKAACWQPRGALGCAVATSAFTVLDLPVGWSEVVIAAPVDARPARLRVEFESVLRVCNDGADNDGDGVVDADDPGCVGALDDDEADDPAAPPACANGVDDDGDGAVDREDPECGRASDDAEGPCPAVVARVEGEGGSVELNLAPGGACADDGASFVRLVTSTPVAIEAALVDDEGAMVDASVALHPACDPRPLVCGDEGLVVARVEPGEHLLGVHLGAQATPGLERLRVTTRPVTRMCENGVDDDGDGAVDALDRGCSGAFDDDETDPIDAPVCDNGEDDDGDGAADFPADADCRARGQMTESLCLVGVRDVPPEGGVFRVEVGDDGPGVMQAARCGGGSPGPEKVFYLRLDEPRRVSVSADSAAVDPMVYLRTTCDDPRTELVCDDDGGVGRGARIEPTVVGPGEVFVVVDTFAVGFGTIDVQIDVRLPE